MSATPWVCGNCRSINQPREGRCYRCRTPRELVEADPDTLIVAGAGASRPPEEIRPTVGYRSSASRAVMTQLLVAAGLAVTVVSSVMGADLVGRLLDGSAAETDTSFGVVGLLGIAGLGLGAAALVSWAMWLSRVVANVPALGLGWPNLTPNQAIFESLIPGVNLYRVPAILRDVVNRLEPNGKGEAIIAAGWLGLVGGLLLPRALSWALLFTVGSLDDFVTLRYVAGQLGLGLTLVGGAVLIYLVQWIETRMRQRASGTVPAAASVPPPAAATTEGVEAATVAAPGPAAAAAWSASPAPAPPMPASSLTPGPALEPASPAPNREAPPTAPGAPSLSPSAHWTAAAGGMRAVPGSLASPNEAGTTAPAAPARPPQGADPTPPPAADA
jgi:hypothetical protein